MSISSYVRDNVPIDKESKGIPITSIRLNLPDSSLVLEAEGQLVARVSFSSGTIYFHGASDATSQAARQIGPSVDGPEGSDSAAQDVAPAESREKERPVVLTGKLLGRVRQGRPDTQGHATSWGRFAAHDDKLDAPRIYSATFHRAAAGIALNLPKDAHLTVEGYPHPSNDPTGKRLDTLSVFRLLNRPSEPESSAGQPTP